VHGARNAIDKQRALRYIVLKMNSAVSIDNPAGQSDNTNCPGTHVRPACPTSAFVASCTLWQLFHPHAHAQRAQRALHAQLAQHAQPDGEKEE
jgi:hypothetical protein